MKKLENFADDINKCSKCGLCQSVCPVYKLTGNDCAVSRGKFVMLDGVLKGELKLNKNIEKYLDMCLKCGKCKSFCPSNIDVCQIFNAAKAECCANTFHGKFEKFIESKFIFGNFFKLARIFVPRKKFLKKGKTKLLYFKGCVNDVYPKVENALKKIFSNLDVEIIEKNFECCGLPFLSSGNLERFEEVKQHNLEIISNNKWDYILTDCASCEDTLKSYGCKNVINAVAFLAQQNVKFKFKKSVKVTFHKPCHLEDDSFLEKIFAKCENLEYVKMDNYDECCGFSGEFALKNRNLSVEISKQKAKNIMNTCAEVVVTTCPACVMGLHQGFVMSHKKAPQIMNILELLAKAEVLFI